MKEATVVCFLQKGKMLLGEKQAKYCAGKIVQPGGKIEPGETKRESAIRESQAECGLTPILDEEPLGAIICRYPSSDKNMIVHIFRTEEFTGDVRDSNELQNSRWYPMNPKTWALMMPGDKWWIHKVIRNEAFQAELRYDDDQQLVGIPVVRSLVT